MNIPDKEKIIKWLLALYPVKEVLPMACHCINVGLAMEAVAQKSSHINSEQAKFMGFLHDVGKMDISTNPNFNGEKHAHDLVGFDFLMKEDFSEIAYASLTHSLLCKDLTSEYNHAMFFYQTDDINRLQTLLANHVYSDAEKLLQLLDWIVQKDHVCSIENSYEFIKTHYGFYEGLDDAFHEAQQLKMYFDSLCNSDIYTLCDNAIIKEWDMDNFERFISRVL